MTAGKRFGILLYIVITALPMAGASEQAPGFALPDNRGAMVFRSSLRGNLLISFFASYCRPCAKELPVLIELEKKYKKQKNVSLILIAVDGGDSGGTAKEKADGFLKKAGIDHDYLIDMYQVVIGKYNPKKELPAVFLVNAAGRIVFKAVGAGGDAVRRLEKAVQGLQ